MTHTRIEISRTSHMHARDRPNMSQHVDSCVSGASASNAGTSGKHMRNSSTCPALPACEATGFSCSSSRAVNTHIG